MSKEQTQMKTIDPHAAEKIRAAISSGKLKSGSWGDGTHAVCMMSALVSGADDTAACVTAGWPAWLVELNVSLFDADVGASDEAAERAQFALRIAELVQVPRDYDKARDLFLISRLDTGEFSALTSLRKNPVDAVWWRDCEKAISTVVALLHKRIAGENVTDEMDAAAAAAARAYADAYTAAHAHAHAAAAAAAAAAARAYADAYTAAHAAARAAADATAYAAARAAAYAAARADLINALEQA